MRHDDQVDGDAYVSQHLVNQTHQLETMVQFADDWPATSCFAGSSGMCQDARPGSCYPAKVGHIGAYLILQIASRPVDEQPAMN